MARFATYSTNSGINAKDKITYSGLIEASELEDSLRYETVSSTIEQLGLFFAANYFSDLVVSNYANLNFADDVAAAAGGIVLGGIYHTSGVLKIRIA